MSDPQNKVPFPLVGEGATLRYRTGDLVTLREKYGEPVIVKSPDPETGFPVDVWETFTDRIDRLVRLNDPIAVTDCLRAGLKQSCGVKPWTGIDYNDLDFGLLEAARPIQSAIILGITGDSYATLLRKQKDAEEERVRNDRLRARGVEFNEDSPDDPPMTPTEPMSSIESSGSDTPPAS